MPNRSAESVEELLDRYLSQGRTSTETTELDAYFSAHPARERAARVLFDALSRSGQTPPDVVRAWAAMRARIERDLIGGVPDPAANRPLFSGGVSRREKSAALRGMEGWGPQTLRRKVWHITASLGIGILGVVIGWNGRARHGTGSAPNSVSTYTTANGERANITLPDGSTVALNVASRLDVPVDYAAGNHTVRLQGQAFFTVTHHEGTPLTVIAGTTTARVLGTNFSVRHYSTDATSTVAVRDGKVAVGNVVLTASQLLEVGPQGITYLRPADASQFSFAAGVLTINSMPVVQAVLELNRWYAVDIRLGDPSLEHGQIEGKFAAGSLSDLAEYLEFLLNARVVRHGRTLTLYHKGRG